MTDIELIQQSRARRVAERDRARRARRRRRVRFGASTAALAMAALLGLMSSAATAPRITLLHAPHVAVKSSAAVATGYGVGPAAAQIRVALRLPLTSGLLFDVRTGQVLWRRGPERRLPIASLTKMMTALVVIAHAPVSKKALITRAAVDYSGSGVGLLPLGRRVSVLTLLYGLLLPSGNDAATALAQHVAGTEARFVEMMNARARTMGLGCTHFSSVSGLADQGNYSCAVDLARIAHAALRHPLLARIVGSAEAEMPLPIKGGKVYLYNNNPLLRSRYPGADGVKTGYTDAAGRCLVATARRGRRWLGIVLLHSADPPDQARRLLDLGFAAQRA